MNEHRKLWRSKMPELPRACASCPFRIGNAKEFGAVVQRLRDAEGIKGKCTPSIVGHARVSLVIETQNRGDFVCHGTAYGPDMKLRPESERRQCAGASRFYRLGQFTRE